MKEWIVLMAAIASLTSNLIGLYVVIRKTREVVVVDKEKAAPESPEDGK